MRTAPRLRLNLKLEGSLDIAVKRAQLRLLFVMCGVFICLCAISLKVVKLTFFYEPEAIKRLSLTKDAIKANYTGVVKQKEKFRKSIYDRNGILISSNLTTSSLFANPKVMIDEDNAAKQLSQVLPELNRADLAKKFKDKKKSFIWLKRNLHPKQKYEVNALGIPGLQFEDEEKRIYPHGNLFAHVLGMVGQDGRGLSGLEKYLDNIGDNNFDKAVSENNINTTLDIRLQAILRDEMVKAFEKHKAFSASGAIMDVNNGEILALVSLPDYDPNLPKNLKQQTLFNNVTLANYELGSVFKPFTLATAIDLGRVNERDVFDATNPIKIGRFSISDFHAQRRPLTTAEVLMYSSNIGTAKIGETVGVEKFQEYLKKLNFYNKLDVEINEKIPPKKMQKWSQVTLLTTSFGHGIATSPLHLVAAMASVANGGLYYQPTLIKRTEDQELTKPSQVFSKKTSERMRGLLRLVVVGGSGGKANAEGYLVGGKTGTANKVDERGRYTEDKVLSTFVGIFPMNAPKYLVMISLDDPKASADTFGYKTAGWVAAPFAGEVIKRIAPILKVQPQEDDSEAIKKKYNIVAKED